MAESYALVDKYTGLCQLRRRCWNILSPDQGKVHSNIQPCTSKVDNKEVAASALEGYMQAGAYTAGEGHTNEGTLLGIVSKSIIILYIRDINAPDISYCTLCACIRTRYYVVARYMCMYTPGSFHVLGYTHTYTFKSHRVRMSTPHECLHTYVCTMY